MYNVVVVVCIWDVPIIPLSVPKSVCCQHCSALNHLPEYASDSPGFCSIASWACACLTMSRWLICEGGARERERGWGRTLGAKSCAMCRATHATPPHGRLSRIVLDLLRLGHHNPPLSILLRFPSSSSSSLPPFRSSAMSSLTSLPANASNSYVCDTLPAPRLASGKSRSRSPTPSPRGSPAPVTTFDPPLIVSEPSDIGPIASGSSLPPTPTDDKSQMPVQPPPRKLCVRHQRMADEGTNLKLQQVSLTFLIPSRRPLSIPLGAFSSGAGGI